MYFWFWGELYLRASKPRSTPGINSDFVFEVIDGKLIDLASEIKIAL